MTAPRVQRLLVAAYVAVIALVLGWTHGPRLVWTVLIAALPAFFVLGGFHLWRRICPLSFFSQIPVMLGRGGTRKWGGRFAAQPLLLPFAVMLVALSLRLLATNGTPWALAALLVGAAAAAAATGAIFRGKTWCNAVCPVGLVERIYTEPVRLMDTANSQCATCSACTPRCPDIDVEQGYWKAADGPSRRAIWFAWPGVVGGFYLHYFLQAGDWGWYFDGAWAYQTDQASHLLSAGYSFAAIPRVVAAPLTLLTCATLSHALFSAGEGAFLRRAPDDAARARVQHRALAVAGFVAFNLFYAFAGQPTLQAGPGWLRWGVATLVVGSSTLLLLRRWVRDEATFVQDRFAKKLAKRWKWGDADRDRAAPELVVIHHERTRARQERLEAYEQTLQELASEGTVSREGLALLGSVRATLGVSDGEHRAIVAKLEADRRDLFDPDRAADRAADLQRSQYRAEVERAVELAADAGRTLDDTALARLRQAHGVSAALHGEVLAELLNPQTGLARRLRAEAERLVELGRIAASTGDLSVDQPARADLLVLACSHAGRPVSESLRGILAAARDERGELPDLASPDPIARGAAAQSLLGAGGSTATVGPPSTVEPAAEPASVDDGSTPQLPLHAACADADPWVALAAAELLRASGRSLPVDAPEPPVGLDRLLQLRAVELLVELGPEDLLAVASVVQPRELATADVVCRQGEAGDDVFLVTGGRLEARVDGVSVGTFGPGQALGELAVLSPAPRAATVQAAEPSSLLVLPGPRFRDLIRDHPTLAEALLRQLARRAQRSA